ncbi:5-oxoprolinase subunit PxpA [Aurantibacter crassamenti]|uniref:5-oxoprolinase subunit PxpA n=1 Tax=Aurantibacter crassamenti TaxID=1837375 RepID=UPI001939ED09|nr:5-oxoprolinase subunit PxpA [Aurantibacter crassamenti]MBM1107280.1 5-oxoprolinase subunit PxpA [Aurantibacter crassamenti]
MNEAIYIDINCDVGEGIGNENLLMPLVSSCNIACGGHAGDNNSMLAVAKLANMHSVKVGAHPSYPDTDNFGRVSMKISSVRLIESIKNQLANFASILKREHIALNHIKAHGALYNDISSNSDLAKIFIKSIENYKDTAILYVPYGSAIAEEAQKKRFKFVQEAYADRNYNIDLSLVSRLRSDAVISEPKRVLEHLVRMVKEKHILSQDGNKVYIEAETFCVHGDTPSAIEILSYLTLELPKMNIYIKK